MNDLSFTERTRKILVYFSLVIIILGTVVGVLALWLAGQFACWKRCDLEDARQQTLYYGCAVGLFLIGGSSVVYGFMNRNKLFASKMAIYSALILWSLIGLWVILSTLTVFVFSV